ncbi:recombination regulator RecX [Paraburkholderia sp. J41]|uniref:recombination regulator RecX n=1 Tax=Paraburkholderia sp. J41 TaxID=2805433 RepID=UPI002AC3575A|nr:recombination regulator RecX [Paraburkholderia sp. J41]
MRRTQQSREARSGGRGFAHSGPGDSLSADYAGHADSAPADLSEDGGVVFEVPFEAFFGAGDESGESRESGESNGSDEYGESRESASVYEANAAASASEKRSRRTSSSFNALRRAAPQAYIANDAEPDVAPSASATPQADRYERSSATRAARQSAREASASTRQRPERSLKGRALGYLSRREYSRAELSRKLMPYVEDADALEVMLDSLERDGWLSDARFAESIVHRRAARVGAGRIVSELKRHAVGESLIADVSTQLRETELVRARAVWRKKYGELPETSAERARQARFLAARGFSMSIIGKILKGIDEDWPGE